MTIPEIVGLMFLICPKKPVWEFRGVPDKKDLILFDTVFEGPRDLAKSIEWLLEKKSFPFCGVWLGLFWYECLEQAGIWTTSLNGELWH